MQLTLRGLALMLLISLSPVNVFAQTGTLTLELVASGLTRAVGFATAPGEVDRFFVVEQPGFIQVVNNGVASPFLDISSKVTPFDPANNESGLLSLVFHPQYANNGYFYIYYTNVDATESILERYTVSANPDVADEGSATAILTIPQDEIWHNGGQMHFGRSDGYLYLSTGDGGIKWNAQQNDTVKGKVLRLDVDSAFPYAIPAGNPYLGIAGRREEIWVKGLRNPWRFSFDRLTGDMYIGDVGFDTWEEVNFRPVNTVGAINFGWCIMEGPVCNSPCGEPPDCNPGSLIEPIHTYEHTFSECANMGGFVYRGTVMPHIFGHFFFADFCSSVLTSLQMEGGVAASVVEWSLESTDGTLPWRISTLGEDSDGELYVVGWGPPLAGQASVYKIIGASAIVTETPASSARFSRMLPSVPNPFNPRIELRFELASAGDVELEIVDARGRIVRAMRLFNQAVGRGSLTWDGKNEDGKALASGIYLVRLKAPDGEDVDKIALIR